MSDLLRTRWSSKGKLRKRRVIHLLKTKLSNTTDQLMDIVLELRMVLHIHGWNIVMSSTSLSCSWIRDKLCYLRSLHTRDREPVTIPLQALSLVEKVEPVQVRFTLRLRDQQSMWMQDECKVYMGFLHIIRWIMFHGHLNYFQKLPLEGRPNPKPRHHGTPNTYNRWLVMFYHVWGPTWIEIHWNSIGLRV